MQEKRNWNRKTVNFSFYCGELIISFGEKPLLFESQSLSTVNGNYFLCTETKWFD